MKVMQTRCCIVGGGPAGMMLGYLIARAGIDVVVLEKYPDFFRDFRGDTIHPSTMDILFELGLLHEFLRLPHNETRQMIGHVGGTEITVADFGMLRSVRSPFIAFIPQWDFLNFLAAKAHDFSKFHLMMDTVATDIVKDGDRIAGVVAQHKGETFEIHADAVIAADGRHSKLRSLAGLSVEDLGSPIDVLWFRIDKQHVGAKRSFGYIDSGKMMVLLDRDDYWQCAYIIEKGSFEAIKERGLPRFRADIASLVPMLEQSVESISAWDEVKLLSVSVDHLRQWFTDGLLCIGDAAHAMSPIGGIGINLAIQDAVATGNRLVPAFKRGRPHAGDFASIQMRRAAAVRRMQALQVFLHKRVIIPILRRTAPLKVPAIARMIFAMPLTRWITARLIGVGLRHERVVLHERAAE